MTQNITINNPSPRTKQFFDALREKKECQISKLKADKECTFTINI